MVVFLLAGCATDPVTVKIEEKMSSAEYALANADYTTARIYYQEVLKLDSSYTPAMFGFIISDTFAKISEIQESLDLLSSIMKLLGPSQTGGISSIIKNFLEDALISTLRAHLDCSDGICFDLIEKDESFQFTASSIPLKLSVGGVPVINLDFGGRFNLGEVYFLEAVFSGIVGFCEIMYTVDLNVSILQLADFLFKPGVLSAISEDPLNGLMRLIASVLNTNPNFLGYNGMKEYLASSQERIVNAFESEQNSITHVLQKGYEEDTILTVHRDKSNTIIFRFHNKLSPQETPEKCEGVSGGRNICVEINITPELTTAIENLKKAFTTPGQFASWAGEIAPVVAVLFQTLIDSGILLNILEYLLVFVEVGAEQKEVIDFLKGFLTPGTISYELIWGLLTAVLPDVIQLSPATLFESARNNKFSIRHILPIWTKYNNSYPSTITDADTIWLEWECGTKTVPPHMYPSLPDKTKLDDLGIGIPVICKKDIPLTDSGHFTDNIPAGDGISLVALSSDGIPSVLPYIYIKDPTFGNGLKVNLSNLPSPYNSITCGGESQWHIPRSNCEINAVLHGLFSSIINLLSGGFSF